MSTVKYNIKQHIFAMLAKLDEEVFHVDDLEKLWNVRDKNTIHTTLKRYAQQALLHRIYRGFYAIKPVDKINPFLLGVKAMHRYSYISAETVLARHGIMQQQVSAITLMSEISKRFSIGNYHYYSRQLRDRFLFNPAGITEQNRIKFASVERAVADMLYFNPRFHFDGAKFIRWKKVRQIQKAVGYPLTPQRYV